MGWRPRNWFEILSILDYFKLWLVLFWKTISLAFLTIALESLASFGNWRGKFREWIWVGPWHVILKINVEYFGLVSQVLLCYFEKKAFTKFYYSKNETGLDSCGWVLSFIVWTWHLILLNSLRVQNTLLNRSISFVLLAYTKATLKSPPHTWYLLGNYFLITVCFMILGKYFLRKVCPSRNLRVCLVCLERLEFFSCNGWLRNCIYNCIDCCSFPLRLGWLFLSLQCC
jgi:hypothetical protein